MANMFSGKTDKHIPKNLRECLEPDPTVTNLHSWAEKLERWGFVALIVILIAGVISTIVVLGNSPTFEEAFFTVCAWLLCAVIEYCVYHALALLISALATITQNTTITANLALLETRKDTDHAEDIKKIDEMKEIRERMESFGIAQENILAVAAEIKKEHASVPTNSWKCLCGRVNPEYTSTCACHRSKTEVLSGTREE